MYLPTAFEETRADVLAALVRSHPLATLVTAEAGKATAEHLPLMLEGEAAAGGVLVGHVARANDVWKRAPSGTEALAIFQGPGHYVSPRWYPSKQEHGKVVPTWNYAVVHVRARLAWREDVPWMRALLERLTDEHEAGAANAWHVGDAPEDYLARMMSGIVGLEAHILEVTGKWKVSQNRSVTDREGVAAGLGALGTRDAGAMQALVKP